MCYVRLTCVCMCLCVWVLRAHTRVRMCIRLYVFVLCVCVSVWVLQNLLKLNKKIPVSKRYASLIRLFTKKSPTLRTHKLWIQNHFPIYKTKDKFLRTKQDVWLLAVTYLWLHARMYHMWCICDMRVRAVFRFSRKRKKNNTSSQLWDPLAYTSGTISLKFSALLANEVVRPKH